MVKKFLLRNIAMFLSLVMLISSTAQTTYGFISVASEPLVNTFVPGESLPPVEPEGKTDSVEICVKKTVVNTGKGEISPAGFSFNLVENKTGKTLTATSDENGDAKFVLEFSKADIGTTFEYSLSEKDTGKAGVTYSTDVFDIKIVVEENEEGNPDAKVVSSVTGETSDSASFGFTNEYHRDFISISIVAQKEFTSESEDHTLSGFVFILNGEEKTTGDDGRVVFDLEFTEPGTYVYELYEKDLGEEGMGYDTAVRTIEIVIAEQDGKLSAEINGVPGLSVTENFTNSYTGGTNPPIILGLVNFSVDAKVSIVNDTDPATPLDQFEIVGDGVTKVTDEEGRTTFYFEVEGELGEEFDFKFYQKPGDIEGLIYDVSENIVTVKFVDDGKGGATVEFYINGVLVTDLSDLTVYFVNRYPTQNEVSVTVEVEKFITNNSKTEVPADVNFSFNLTDKETGEVIDFVNVEGTGRKAFGDLVFTEEDLGTHYYTISEVKGSAEGFEYSTEIHELTVTVSKDGEGKVFAKVLLNGTENTLATFTLRIYNNSDTTKSKGLYSKSDTKIIRSILFLI